MQAVKTIIGLALFTPLFFAVMWYAGHLADKNRAGLGWLALAAGLGSLITATVVFGHMVR